jgi:uncharacterized protein YodC (DUF2158 family)
MTFQPGDIVALKSGGQFMTVSRVSDDGAECMWIGEEGELFRETLPLAVLKTIDDDADTADDEDDADDDENEVEEDSEAEPGEEARKIA